MDDNARAKNREKVAAYRARLKTRISTAKTSTGDAYRVPTRLDTYIGQGIFDVLSAFAEATGTNKSLIVERALTEYFIKYSAKYAPEIKGMLAPRKLAKDEDLPALDENGQLSLTVLPKDKPLDFPPVAE